MHCCLVLVVFAVAASPCFYSEHFAIWSSVKDRLRILGAVHWRTSKAAFSLNNVPSQVAMIWSEITASWDQFR